MLYVKYKHDKWRAANGVILDQNGVHFFDLIEKRGFLFDGNSVKEEMINFEKIAVF